MRHLLSAVVGLFVLVVLASLAYAQGDPSPEENRNALQHLVEIAFQILMVVLPVVATWLTHKAISVFESKTKLDVPAKVETQIDGWVYKGINFAAEKSYQKVKDGAGKLTGPEKLETAADFVMNFVEQQGWVDWTRDKIKDKIESAMGELRNMETNVPDADKR